MRLVPKGWTEFQHYRDRRPPWIKLHRSILDDRVFMTLPLASKALAPFLWLLASESEDGSFDGDPDELRFRLRFSDDDLKSGLEPLLRAGFFLDASTMLAPCLQPATPEREGEREKRREEKKVAAAPVDRPDDVSEQVWAEYLRVRKKPLTALALKGIQREATAAGKTIDEALTICIERGWQGFDHRWLATGTGSPPKWSKPVTHIQNLPLGTASCGCQDCISYRSKKEQTA